MKHISGVAGEAWFPDMERKEGDPLDWTASRGLWLIRAPGQSPAWSFYVLTMVSMEDIPGVPPAKKKFPSATHEIMLLALDPELGPDLNGENFVERKKQFDSEKQRSIFLRPVNYVKQFEASEEQAAQLLGLFAEGIVRGALPAEPFLSGGDYWSEALEATLEHIKLGHHPKKPGMDTGLGKT